MFARQIAVAAAVFCLCSCCAKPKQSTEGAVMNSGKITGSVTYRQRIALDPAAVVNVRLEDVSRADAPADLIAETNVRADGRQVPIPFEISFDEARIQPNHQYNVRASIRVGEELRWTSATAHPVLTQGNGNTAEIWVDPVRETPPVAGAQLIGTHWKLLELNGKPIVPVEEALEAHLMFHADDHRFSGVGGVNRLMGGFELNGNQLKILPGPSTMMAGPEPLMKQEQEFVQMLMKVNSYRISGNAMELLDGERMIAKFAAGTPK